MKENDLLPVGSIVLLKKGTHRLMIMGFSPLRKEGKLQLYDYWACFYPEGLLNLDQTLVFNKKDIDKVISVGYSDDEEKVFRAKLINIINDLKDENGNLKLDEGELAKYMVDAIKGGNK